LGDFIKEQANTLAQYEELITGGVEHGFRQRQPSQWAPDQIPDRGRQLQPRVRAHRRGLGHLGAVRHPPADRAAIFRGYPLAVRTDNGPEFTSRAWAHSHGVSELLLHAGALLDAVKIRQSVGKLNMNKVTHV